MQRAWRTCQIQPFYTRICTLFTPQPPHTSHPHSTKQMPAISKTHQIKISQSCRENNAIKAADLVAFLRMTCRRQIQRRNTSHRTTYTPQPPHTSHPHTTKQMPAITTIHQIKLRQSCRENNAIKAADLVAGLRMTCRRQIQRRISRNARIPFTRHRTMKPRNINIYRRFSRFMFNALALTKSSFVTYCGPPASLTFRSIML